MPTLFPITDFFNITDFATPATYINAAGVSKDINIIFEKSITEDRIGTMQACIEVPIAFCQSSDVADVSKGAKIVLNALIESDDGKGYIVDQLGNLIVAENIATYYVIDNHGPGN